jgi:deoxycytidine triphosphate deaminase
MILSGNNIVPHVVMSEFSKVNQVGIDLSVKNIERIIHGGRVLKNKTEINKECYVNVELKDDFNTWYLTPGVYSLTLNEKITIPPTHTGFTLHRSSITRMGGLIVSAVWDPGFTTGDNDMGVTLYVYVPMEIEKNARVAQFYMIENQPVDSVYDGQWNNKTNY